MKREGPDAWGPHAWKFLHYVSLGYSENPTNEEKQKYKLFFMLLKDVLPCSTCRKHYSDNLDILPLTDDNLSSRDNLVKWVIDLHNIVNKMKNKPIISYDQAIELITNNFEENNDYNIHDNNIQDNNITQEGYNDIIKLVIILIGIVFIYTILKKRNSFK